jgi:hypothetical protein
MAAAPAVVTAVVTAVEMAVDAVVKASAATVVAMAAVDVVQTVAGSFSHPATKALARLKAKAVDAPKATTTRSINPQQVSPTKVAHRALAMHNPTRCAPTSI